MKAMKNRIAILLAIVAVSSSCQSLFARRIKVEGNGNPITRTVAVGNFHEIEASRAVKVIITDGQPGQVTVTAEENLMEYVSVRVHEGELEVTIKPAVSIVTREDIVVRVPDNGNIRSLEASSAAKILSEKPLEAGELEVDASAAAMVRLDVKANSCDLDASSAAHIAVRVEAQRVEADASSGSKIILQGTAHSASYEASSGAEIEASELTVQVADTEASSGANIRVRCEQRLDSRTSSGGTVSYSGVCRVDSSNTLGSTRREGN